MIDKNIIMQPFILSIRKKGEIGLFRSVMRVLNFPDIVNFWWCESEKGLLIGSAESKTPTSVYVRWNNSNPRNGASFFNQKLLKSIQTLVGTDDGVEFKMFGEFVPEINMVIFRTSNIIMEADGHDR